MLIWTVASWSVLLVTLATLPLARRRPAWIRLGVDLVALGVFSLTIQPLVGSILEPRFHIEAAPVALLADKLLLAAWWMLAGRTLVLVGEWALRVNHQNHAARFASDLVAGTIYIGVALAIADTAFGVSLTGLIATSGVIAIVLGLALQSTLSDLFSGIAVRLDRPFFIGDLIRVDDATEGRVIEMNWRSTRIATNEGDLATVPNSVVAKAKLLNRSHPTEVQNDKVTILLDPRIPVERSIEILSMAALVVSDVSPRCRVACSQLRGDGIRYDVHFSAPVTVLDITRSKLLQEIERHVRHAGIALATDNGTPPIHAAPVGLMDLLTEVHVLEALSLEERASVAGSLIRHDGGVGRPLFRQGESSASLFVLAQGTLEVVQEHEGQSRRLGTFGPGDYFGELALLCGLPNAVTVTSLTPFRAYEVTKATLEPLLRANPDLAVALNDGAQQAQALLHRAMAVQTVSGSGGGISLLGRIRAYFAIASNAG